MIIHLAVFTWVDGVGETHVEELTTALQEMAAELPMLRAYHCGASLGLRPGADFGVVAVVDDAAALEAYLGSPGHRAVYDRLLGRMIAERQAVQIPFGSAGGVL
ncbi:Dabb family protein [Agromyces binzhouensis]|uniref:Dabb family protein n=1 Tax=Agromyces binzhouensis TaxID=1817495 RepID=A0A4Q2JZI4_9MICO|nr:Dabb family protein [Agromyces binzhouensis]RXZ51688.1 Dabb family protein [Agromyces binzhouensis]